jgi:mitotic spindle assembly checkpoint protein MAD2
LRVNDLSIFSANTKVQTDEKRTRQEISDVLRQITAAVSFLPLLEGECAFDVLLYTHKSAKLNNDWADATACNIENPEEVQVSSSFAITLIVYPFQLRSFSTKVHSVQTKVQYKADI